MVSAWRMCRAEDGRGLLMYFDPFLEDPSIRQLTGPERADRLTSPLACAQLTETETLPLDFDYVPNHNEIFEDGTS